MEECKVKSQICRQRMREGKLLDNESFHHELGMRNNRYVVKVDQKMGRGWHYRVLVEKVRQTINQEMNMVKELGGYEGERMKCEEQVSKTIH